MLEGNLDHNRAKRSVTGLSPASEPVDLENVLTHPTLSVGDIASPSNLNSDQNPAPGFSRRAFMLGQFPKQQRDNPPRGLVEGNNRDYRSDPRTLVPLWNKLGPLGRIITAATAAFTTAAIAEKRGNSDTIGPKVGRRNFLSLLLTGLSAAAVGASCTSGGKEGAETIPTQEADFDALSLLEKDNITADEMLSYLTWAGVGGYMSYLTSEAVFDLAYENPRQAILRSIWSAANNGDNRNFRRDLRALFEAVDNTKPKAHGYIIPNDVLATPNQFKAWDFRNSDNTFPTSWAEAELHLADTAEVTDDYFGGFTTEYVQGQPIKGIDLSQGQLRFLGESRDNKLIAISHTDVNGVTREFTIKRNVVFPNFNQVGGYDLIEPSSQRRVTINHLEARHNIAQIDMDNLFNGLGQTSRAEYIARGPKNNAYFQVGIRDVNNGQLYDMVLKYDDEAARLVSAGNIDDALAVLKQKHGTQNMIVTAYQPFSRLNGQNRGVQGMIDRMRGTDKVVADLHRRIRGIQAISPPANNGARTYVFEMLDSGEWVQMPEHGPWDIKLAAQLGRYVRAHPRFGEKVLNFTKRLQTMRPIISPALGMIGVALSSIAEQAVIVGAEAQNVYQHFQPWIDFAAIFDRFRGEGFHQVGPDLYIQHMSMPLGNSPDFIDPTTGQTQLEVNQVVPLPPILGLPSDPFSQTLPFLALTGVQPRTYTPMGGLDLGAVTDFVVRDNYLRMAHNPFVSKGDAMTPEIMNKLYGCINGPFLAEESLNVETGASAQEALSNQFPFGVPTIPVPYGETANLGFYRHPDGTLRFTVINYAADGGIIPGSEDLGTELQVPVTVCPIRDLVNQNGGNYEETIRKLSPQTIEERTTKFMIRYSIINNNTINITVVRE